MLEDFTGFRLKQLELFVGMILLGFILSVYVCHYNADFLHFDYPKNTFLFTPSRAGDDLFSLLEAFRSGDFYASQGSMYFPGCTLFLYPLSFLDDRVAFLIYAGVVLTAFFAFSFGFLIKIGLDKLESIVVSSILVFLSYPILFCIDRGNLEGFSAAFLILYIVLFRRQAHWIAAIALAVAAAVKIYPIIFGVLFLKRRYWRQAVFSGGLAILFNVVPAALLPGGIVHNVSRMFENQRIGNLTVGMTIGGIPYGLSLFSLVKVVCILFFGGVIPNGLFAGYIVFAGIVTLACFYFAQKYLNKTWEILFFVFAPWLIFPQISYDYKLIWVLIPAVLMFEDKELALVDVMLMAALFIPKNLVPLGIGIDEVSWAVVVNPLLVICIAVRILTRAAPILRGADHGQRRAQELSRG